MDCVSVCPNDASISVSEPTILANRTHPESYPYVPEEIVGALVFLEVFWLFAVFTHWSHSDGALPPRSHVSHVKTLEIYFAQRNCPFIVLTEVPG